MSRKVTLILFVVVALSLMIAVPALAGSGGRPGSNVVVYVTGQKLYYDSIVGPDLPPHGRVQLLEMGPNGLQTKFGPGDPGYLGGRWWEDLNGNNRMDEDDHFFLCPLLGPGRDMP